jgi:hypothetical protein
MIEHVVRRVADPAAKHTKQRVRVLEKEQVKEEKSSPRRGGKNWETEALKQSPVRDNINDDYDSDSSRTHFISDHSK